MSPIRCARPWLVPLAFAASSALAAANDIHDIRGPLPIDVLPPFTLTGGLLLLVAGLFFILRHRRHHQTGEAPPASAPVADAADRLARIGAEYRQGIVPGELTILRLDAVVRDGLALVAGLPAQRLTSVELLSDALAGLDAGQQALLGELLPLFDRVKFAGHLPAAQEVERSLEVAARLLVAASQGRTDAPA